MNRKLKKKTSFIWNRIS